MRKSIAFFEDQGRKIYQTNLKELNRLRDKETLPAKLEKAFNQMCQLGHTCYKHWVRFDDINRRAKRLSRTSPDVATPHSHDKGMRILAFITLIAIAFIDYFLLRGFLTMIMSMGAAIGEPWLTRAKILLPLLLICIELALALFSRQNDLLSVIARLWPITIAGITVIVFLAGEVFSAEDLDLILIVEVTLLGVIAYAVHALPIAMAGTILQGILWLHYLLFFRPKHNRLTGKLKKKLQPLYAAYLNWQHLHHKHGLSPNYGDIPGHIVELINECVDKEHIATGKKPQPVVLTEMKES